MVFNEYCVEEYKDLSKEEIIKLIEDGNVNNVRIKDINTEDLGLNDSKVVYDILYTSKLPNSNERIGLYFNRVLEREAPTSNKQSLLSGGSESLQYP